MYPLHNSPHSTLLPIYRNRLTMIDRYGTKWSQIVALQVTHKFVSWRFVTPANTTVHFLTISRPPITRQPSPRDVCKISFKFYGSWRAILISLSLPPQSRHHLFSYQPTSLKRSLWYFTHSLDTTTSPRQCNVFEHMTYNRICSFPQVLGATAASSGRTNTRRNCIVKTKGAHKCDQCYLSLSLPPLPFNYAKRRLIGL